MNHNAVMAIVTASALSLPGSVNATEVRSEKHEPCEVAAVHASSAPPSAKAADTKKGTETLKWDQLDPKALESVAKKAHGKGPFATVPAER